MARAAAPWLHAGVTNKPPAPGQPVLARAGRRVVGRDHLHLDIGNVRHPRRLVVGEVRLLHATVLDNDFLPQHVAETVDDAALGLRGDVPRLHGYPGVDRDPDIVNLDLAGGALDRNLGAARVHRTGLHHG